MPSTDERLPKELWDWLGQASTATVTTQLFKRGLRRMHLSGVRPVSRRRRLMGEALTLRYIPSREDLDILEVFQNPEHPQRKAIELAKPGQVLVMDARGETRAASAGHILATRLLRRGAAGLVTDGALRDSGGIAEMDFAVYAAGASPALNLTVHHAVDIGVPIGCGGVPVFPGDVVLGDEEAVVVIPRQLAVEVARDAAEQERLESFILEKVEGGAALPGIYPPNARTLEEYGAWRQARGGGA
ncbi:MAG TPA: ribonuclease activity regulator RraA [Methylomirabilota bacterium]|nr:ribonuclease activity regulator RraA [Methylomirabilota bacterium]